MPVSTSRPARPQGDPDKYIRTVKGGKYQARPYDAGVRYNLGLFHTKHQARHAIEQFWWGRRPARYRFVRPLRGSEQYAAVIRGVPSRRDRKAERAWRAAAALAEMAGLPRPRPPEPGPAVTVRVGDRYPTAEAAFRAAYAWLAREVGPLVAWFMAEGEKGWTPSGVRLAGPAAA